MKSDNEIVKDFEEKYPNIFSRLVKGFKNTFFKEEENLENDLAAQELIIEGLAKEMNCEVDEARYAVREAGITMLFSLTQPTDKRVMMYHIYTKKGSPYLKMGEKIAEWHKAGGNEVRQ